MNKKFSTLMAGLLIAGFSSVATMAHAQKHSAKGLDLKSEIAYRTQSTKPDAFDYYWGNNKGVNKIESTKWYQLEVGDCECGPDWPGQDYYRENRKRPSVPPIYGGGVLVQYRDYDTGELRLKVVAQEELEKGTVANQGKGSKAISSPSLNSSLWKIEVVDRTPGSLIYKFTNKETGYELSYSCDDAVNLTEASDLSGEPVLKSQAEGTVNKSDVNGWRWYTYDSMTSEFGGSKLYTFNHDGDKVLGLALAKNNDVVLVDIPASEVVGYSGGNAMISAFNVLSFTVRNAGARVLNAADINSMIDADGSWANRDNSDLIAKFKEVSKGFAKNDFFTTNYKAIDTDISEYKNTSDVCETGGYSIVLKDNDSKAGEEKYLMVATDETYENDQLPSIYRGLVVSNNTYTVGTGTALTESPMTALKARYHWKVTYFPTPDSLVFEPLNASIVSDSDKRAGIKWAKTELASAEPGYYFNTVNEGIAHQGNSASYTNVPFNKDRYLPVALILMNNSDGSVLTVGQPSNSLVPYGSDCYCEGSGYHHSHKYGYPLLTVVPANMGLKIRFDHTYNKMTRGSVANDVYFIQISVAEKNKTSYRKEGMYLVYNMEGRLMYDLPEEYQNYEQMPATQWVVERDTCERGVDNVPYVTIRNREYGDKAPVLFYGQLYKTGEKYYIINHTKYDVKSDGDGKFPKATPYLSCGDTLYFNPVAKATKADASLGYKKFDAEKLKYETYIMKYLQADYLTTPTTSKYLSVDSKTGYFGVNEDLWNDFEVEELYADNKFGAVSKKADAVQLKRTVYALKVRDTNTIDNEWRYVVIKEDASGNMYYHMAHLKDVDGKNVKLGTFYFKADQVAADKTTTAYALVDATGFSKDASFKREYWVNGLKFGNNTIAARDSMLLSVNPNDTDIYKNRLFVENGYKRADAIDGTMKLTRVSLNTAPGDRVSAFIFTSDNRPLYQTIDAAENVNIYRELGSNGQTKDYFYEDSHNSGGLTAGEYIKNFRYLGITSEGVKPQGFDKGTTTAYYVEPVRASSERMPKYMFFVDTDSVADGYWCNTNTHGYFDNKTAAEAGDKSHHVFYNGYLAGRVMVNLNDSVDYYSGIDMLEQAHKYGYRNYTRLGFVEAIHMDVAATDATAAFGLAKGEYLIVLKNTTLEALTKEWGVIDPVKLNAALGKTAEAIKLTAAHQNVAFSLRITEDGSDGYLLESKGRKFDGYAGTFSEASWLQEVNGVPVLAQYYNVNGSHSNIDGVYNMAGLINQSQIIKIGETAANATANETIDMNGVIVLTGKGSVTILNAAGKTVTISNILGQTVAKQVVTSDNASIVAPKGIVVVAVQGEEAVKAIVK